ncbi:MULTISPECIES: hypothetical protein [unclassified Streptomyces]|uniref:hypothetical protein n=1 Tax=unclassified Streptomyces TaxID=2593676 RepID=UPI003BB6903A
MDEPTQDTGASTTPNVIGWCAWHQGYARGVRLIQAQEQGSGVGAHAFACRPCREAYDLVPFADRPL